MTTVAITGAAGNVGTQARRALADHDLTLVTHREHEGLDSVVLDLSERDALEAAFAGQDVVVHMAGNPSPNADWDAVLDTNVDGTRNVYEAALSAGVDRIVFASSNHVQHMYNAADPTRPGTTREHPRTVDHDDPFRPTSFYGVSKIAGEALGCYYADRYGIEVVNQRIGWLLSEDELREYQTDDEGLARHARALWLSPRDCRQAMRRSVEADPPENPLTVNILSRNSERYFSITHALRSLGFRPRDDASEVLDRNGQADEPTER